jgi:hypothetical protein
MKELFAVVAYRFSEGICKPLMLWSRGWKPLNCGAYSYVRDGQVLNREFALEKSEKEIREIIKIAYGE